MGLNNANFVSMVNANIQDSNSRRFFGLRFVIESITKSDAIKISSIYGARNFFSAEFILQI